MTSSVSAMEVYIRVVESGSFTRAAEMLNLPKASVSQYVARLEAHLGVRLLLDLVLLLGNFSQSARFRVHQPRQFNHGVLRRGHGGCERDTSPHDR